MKESFYRTFCNVPLPERSNPIFVDHMHGAMSWHIVKLEVDSNTEVGKRALAFLKEAKII